MLLYACALLMVAHVRGDKGDVLKEERLEGYLKRFGYINDNPGVYAQPADVSSALADLQTFAGLEPTGELDDATIKLLETPRCALKDHVHDRRERRYLAHNSKWKKHTLTWMLTNSNNDGLTREQVEAVFAEGAQMWADVSPLKFQKLDYVPKSTNGTVYGRPILSGKNKDRCGPKYGADCPSTGENSCCSPGAWCGSSQWHCKCTFCVDFKKPQTKADIDVRFSRRDHGDGMNFDGPSNVLAHAFYPFQNLGLAGDVHFDDDENWTIKKKTGINLLWVIVHELGHSLGLQHSNVRDAVMYPYYLGYKPGFSLRPDDINGIRSIYKKSSSGSTKAPSTAAPTKMRTPAPTPYPTKAPTHPSTKAPTYPPTKAPTHLPTKALTHLPTKSPTPKPTTEICQDKSNKCHEFDTLYCRDASIGWEKWMRNNCARRCDFCIGAPTKKPCTDRWNISYCRANKHLCDMTSGKDWEHIRKMMRLNCSQTCNTCQ